MPKIFCIFLFLNAFCYAEISDLKQYQENLKLNSIAIIPESLAIISASIPLYKLPSTDDLFDSKRVEGIHDSANKNDTEYNLNQLKMVGYIHYQNIDYALLETPFTTIKVKPGDMIKDARVIKITSSNLELSQLQKLDGQNFTRKIFLKIQPLVLTKPSLLKVK